MFVCTVRALVLTRTLAHSLVALADTRSAVLTRVVATGITELTREAEVAGTADTGEGVVRGRLAAAAVLARLTAACVERFTRGPAEGFCTVAVSIRPRQDTRAPVLTWTQLAQVLTFTMLPLVPIDALTRVLAAKLDTRAIVATRPTLTLQ